MTFTKKIDSLGWSDDPCILKKSQECRIQSWERRAFASLFHPKPLTCAWQNARCYDQSSHPPPWHDWEGKEVCELLFYFFVRHQGLVFSISWSVSKLQGQHFGGPSFAFPFQGTSGQFWEQLSCAWKMSSAFGNYTFLLTPGVPSGATSMTDRWEEVQLGHHKWFIWTQWAGPWVGRSCLNSWFREKSGEVP